MGKCLVLTSSLSQANKGSLHCIYKPRDQDIYRHIAHFFTEKKKKQETKWKTEGLKKKNKKHIGIQNLVHNNLMNSKCCLVAKWSEVLILVRCQKTLKYCFDWTECPKILIGCIKLIFKFHAWVLCSMLFKALVLCSSSNVLAFPCQTIANNRNSATCHWCSLRQSLPSWPHLDVGQFSIASRHKICCAPVVE